MIVFVIKMKVKFVLDNFFSYGGMIILDLVWVFCFIVVRFWCIFWNCGFIVFCEVNLVVIGENVFVIE